MNDGVRRKAEIGLNIEQKNENRWGTIVMLVKGLIYSMYMHALLPSVDMVKERNSCLENFGVATLVKLHEKESTSSSLGLFFLLPKQMHLLRFTLFLQ